MKLYEFAVIYQPKPAATGSAGPPTEAPSILVPPICVLARDEKHAAMLAARAVPESHADKLDEVDVAVRPF